jgi:hypothetical protein
MLKGRLSSADMMRLFGLKKSAFYQLQNIGRFDPFEIKPRIGRRMYSAKKVQAYLDGEGVGTRDAKPKAQWRFKSA